MVNNFYMYYCATVANHKKSDSRLVFQHRGHVNSNSLSVRQKILLNNSPTTTYQ